MAKYLRFINLMNINKGCERLRMDSSLLTDTPRYFRPLSVSGVLHFLQFTMQLYLGAGHGYITNNVTSSQTVR